MSVVCRYATEISLFLSPSLLKMKVHAGPASTRSIRVWNFFLRAPAGSLWPNVRRIVSIHWRVERWGKKLRWRRTSVWKTSTGEHVTSASAHH